MAPAGTHRLTVTPPGEARERILRTAFRLFYAHGVRGAGVDTIIAESGVAKATFYRHFPSKDDLAVAYLSRVDELWRGQLEAAAGTAGADPRARLVGMFDALAEVCHQADYHGCAFINAAAESAPGSAVHARTVQHKATVRAWVRDTAERAGADSPDALARALTLLLDGALAEGVLAAEPSVAQAAKDAAAALVEIHCRGQPPRFDQVVEDLD
ncbi:MAG: TetR/AcrR family transcriptional regulator [Candidatus Dormibacteria bacterium]|jgi:AcrR family transcriptional regulator|nr:TetR/AcrR family transcriptional regulator [Chloroflexota bacterium]